MARLTGKQQRFVEEYLVDLNATQAAIRAGYSPKTAEAIGYENLRKPQISEAIEKARAAISERTGITQEMVLRELAAIGFARATDYVQIRDGCVCLTESDALSVDQKRAVACIKEGKHGIEVRTYDKLRALELLGQHLGMFEGKSELDLREQEARIANLEKQASRDEAGSGQITVVLEGALDEYAG